MDGAIIKSLSLSEIDREALKKTKWKQEGAFKWY
jgi:hypothetical protein